MIIDFHSHWWPSDSHVHSRKGWDLFISGINSMYYKPGNIDMPDEELEKRFFDADASDLLQRMDAAKIDKTVLLPLDWGNVFGPAKLDIIEQNFAFARLSQKHPTRIISFFSIDPKRENGLTSFVKAIEEWGMRGLKLYPPTGFYPYDNCLTSFYELCLSKNLPVVFHGTDSPMTTEPYCHPEAFGKLARLYPDLKIVIAHAGGLCWLNEATLACQEHENIYLDISGWQSIGNSELFKAAIEELVKSTLFSDKILFGTDSPIFNGLYSVENMVENLKTLNIPPSSKDHLLGLTAKKILGI